MYLTTPILVTSTNPMDKESSAPPVSRALIEAIESAFPPFKPKPAMSDREIMFLAGQQYVVEQLKTWRKWREDEGILD